MKCQFPKCQGKAIHQGCPPGGSVQHEYSGCEEHPRCQQHAKFVLQDDDLDGDENSGHIDLGQVTRFLDDTASSSSNNNNNNQTPNARHESNLFTQPPLRIGVCTWNMNHYDVASKDLGLDDETDENEEEDDENEEEDDDVDMGESLPSGKTMEDDDEKTNVNNASSSSKGVEDSGSGWVTVPCVSDDTLAAEFRKLAAAADALQASTNSNNNNNNNAPAHPGVDYPLRIERIRALGKLCGWTAPTDKVDLDNGEALQTFKDAIRRLKGELKRRAMVRCISALFDRNPWLHAMLLHEVNCYDAFDGYMQQNSYAKERLAWCPGPTMKSAGRSGQVEYYPIVFRKGAVEYREWFAFGQDGKPTKTKLYKWNKHAKPKPTFRPVVVHKVRIGGKSVCLGIVHTTPGSSGTNQTQDAEFFRPNEYAQLENFFNRVNGEIDQNDAIWIIGGDYYLAPEAIVMKLSDVKNANVARRLLREAGYNGIDELWNAYQQSKPNKSFVEYAVTALGKEHRKDLLDKGIVLQEKKEKKEKEPQQEKRVMPSRSVRQQRSSELKPPTTDAKPKRAGRNVVIVPSASRDYARNVLRLTFERVLPGNLGMAYCASGSNWHGTDTLSRDRTALVALRRSEPPNEQMPSEQQRADLREIGRFYARARVADFFVYDRQRLQSRVVGLMHPAGKLMLADTEDSLACSTFWSLMSDHFPVGAQFSFAPTDSGLYDVVRYNKEEAERAAVWQTKFRIASRLAWLLNEDGEAVVDYLLKEQREWKGWLSALISAAKNHTKYKKERDPSLLTWRDANWQEAKAFNNDPQCWKELKRLLTIYEKDTTPDGICFDYAYEVQPQDFGFETDDARALEPLVFAAHLSGHWTGKDEDEDEEDDGRRQKRKRSDSTDFLQEDDV